MRYCISDSVIMWQRKVDSMCVAQRERVACRVFACVVGSCAGIVTASGALGVYLPQAGPRALSNVINVLVCARPKYVW